MHDGGDRGDELVAALPGGEQVDVLAGPLDEPGGLDRVTAGQREAVSIGCPEPDSGEAFVEGVHRYAALLRVAASSGKASSQRRRS